MRPARSPWSSLVASLLAAAGCSVGPPVVNPPGQTSTDASVGTAWADSVFAFVQGGNVVDCSDGLPDCSSTFQQTGSCANNAALGPMDNNPLVLAQGDTITLGFKCSSITEVGSVIGDGGVVTQSADFQIFGTATGPVYPVVEVSQDGSVFYSVNQWTKLTPSGVNPGFDLMYTTMTSTTTMPIVYAKYVRITQAGYGTASIDAVESLRAVK